MKGSKILHGFLLLLVTAVFIWSGINPHDRKDWLLEVSPAILSVLFLLIIYKKFKFTNLSYIILAYVFIIMSIGGHFTYQNVPLPAWFSAWLKEIFNFGRNHYDRFGHFFLGVAVAIVTRELLIRTSPLKPGKWLAFLSVSVALTFGAVYELIEWFGVIYGRDGGQQYVGAQGDLWDAQWDMFVALVGALLAILTLSSLHNKEIFQVRAVAMKKMSPQKEICQKSRK